jgi:hypothetical protein
MDRARILRDILNTEPFARENEEEEEKEEDEEEDDEGEEIDLDEILASCFEETEKTDEDRVSIYADEDPYRTVEMNEETGLYQVIGNEIIMMTRGEGYCCMCHEKTVILYVDNSYGVNIPAQLCGECIRKIMS